MGAGMLDEPTVANNIYLYGAVCRIYGQQMAFGATAEVLAHYVACCST
jgi:hypothetical protein